MDVHAPTTQKKDTQTIILKLIRNISSNNDKAIGAKGAVFF